MHDIRKPNSCVINFSSARYSLPYASIFLNLFHRSRVFNSNFPLLSVKPYFLFLFPSTSFPFVFFLLHVITSSFPPLFSSHFSSYYDKFFFCSTYFSLFQLILVNFKCSIFIQDHSPPVSAELVDQGVQSPII